MKPSKPSIPNTTSRRGDHRGGGRGGRNEEDIEDDEIEKNEVERDFPTFLPTEAETMRKKRQAKEAIREIVDGMKPVVPFAKPELMYSKPPWNASAFVKREYINDLDLLSVRTPPQKEKPPLTQPHWVNSIPRVVSGCPQLGLRMNYEVTGDDQMRDNPLQSDKRRKMNDKRNKNKGGRSLSPTGRHVVATAGSLSARAVENAFRDGAQRVSALEHAVSNTPRFVNETKTDFVVQLIQDPHAARAIKQAVLHPENRKRGKALVTLPKIGVRLFAIDQGQFGEDPSQLQRSPSSSGRTRSMNRQDSSL